MRNASWIAMAALLVACDGSLSPALAAPEGQPLEKKASCNSCPNQIAEKVERAQLSEKDSPSLGASGAPVTVTVFSDFECPYCAKGAKRMQELRQKYGDRVRLVFRHMPLAFHQDARLAAKAAIAASRQGQFWELHDRMFGDQRALDRASLLKKAGELGLDAARFERDLEGQEVEADLAEDEAEAKRLGVTGTPTFFINGRRLTGAQPLEEFSALIDEELKK